MMKIKMLASVFVVLFMVSWALAQEKKTPTSYELAVVTGATPTPSPSPTPTPKVEIQTVYVPVPVQQFVEQVSAQSPAQSTPKIAPKLLADEVRRLLQQEVAKSTIVGDQKFSKELSGVSVDGGGYPGFARPPFALELNKNNFDTSDNMQARLRVTDTLHRGKIYRFSVNLENSDWRFADLGTHVFIPGETIPIQSYIWEGSEARGFYFYGVMVIDPNSGQITAEAVSNFVFGGFREYSNQYYARIDSAESISGRDGWVHLRGNFFWTGFDPRLHQYVEIGGTLYQVAFATNSDAWVMTANVLPGIYDVTFIVHFEGNIVYDSVTAPSALKIFPTFTPGGGKG